MAMMRPYGIALQEMSIIRIAKTLILEITHGNVTCVKYHLQKEIDWSLGVGLE